SLIFVIQLLTVQIYSNFVVSCNDLQKLLGIKRRPTITLEDPNMKYIINHDKGFFFFFLALGYTYRMLQIIQAIMKDPKDETLLLFYFKLITIPTCLQQTEKDILLLTELEEIIASHLTCFKLWYTIDRAPDDRISCFCNLNHLPPPADDTLILMCGPPPMIQFACNPSMDKVGHSSDRDFTF
uniref:cytochrome-b5 reductase n=1 Tax=Cyprinus carpio carpio TaxID=630221 RepID=A0A9J8BC65_CYPCA